MKMLEDRIRKDGIVREGNVLKVDSFINHQMDIPLFREMAREWKRLFAGKPINKVLTIEASGIGIAAVVASELNVPVVFAKSMSINLDYDGYQDPDQSTPSPTKDIQRHRVQKVPHPGGSCLIIDDFLASSCALMGLLELAGEAGATVRGHRHRREKGFQQGGELIRSKGISWRALPSWTPWTAPPARSPSVPSRTRTKNHYTFQRNGMSADVPLFFCFRMAAFAAAMRVKVSAAQACRTLRWARGEGGGVPTPPLHSGHHHRNGPKGCSPLTIPKVERSRSTKKLALRRSAYQLLCCFSVYATPSVAARRLEKASARLEALSQKRRCKPVFPRPLREMQCGAS